MMYEYAGYYHDNGEDGKWMFERPADVVVIHLSANDSDRGTTYEEMAAGAKAFMQTVREKNPDAAIVWATGETYLKFKDQLDNAVQELGGAEKGFYFTVLPEGTSGGAGHPNLEEHAATAEVLTQFLKENVPLPAKPAPNNVWLWIALGAASVVAAMAVVLRKLFKRKNMTA